MSAPAEDMDAPRESGVYARLELASEATIATVRALYGLASVTILERRLACSVLIRELADEVAAGGPVSVARLERLRAMGDEAAQAAVRIIEEGAAW